MPIPLTTNSKGLIAELEIELVAMRLGIPVLKPQEHARSDLALDVFGRIWRVQCKWGRLSPRGDVVIVHTGTERLSTNGRVRTTYRETEIDLFGVYSGDSTGAFCFRSRWLRASINFTSG